MGCSAARVSKNNSELTSGRGTWKDVKQAGQNHQGGADGHCIHWQIDNREWGAWRECFTGMPFFALKYL